MNIYVGNLAPDVTEDDLRRAFEAFGQASSVDIIKDKYTGESRGFGFVVIPDDQQAQAAIDGLNGQELKGKPLRVSQAKGAGAPGGGGGGRGPREGSRGPREGRGGGDRW